VCSSAHQPPSLPCKLTEWKLTPHRPHPAATMVVQMESPGDAEEAAQAETTRTVVVKAHDSADETQLKLQVGDIVYVLEQDETGWWGGHKEGEDLTGWFPGSCVRPMPEESQQDNSFSSVGPVAQAVGAAENPSAFCSIASLAAPTEAGTITSLAAPPEACHAEEALVTANSALETGVRSPLRHSLVVASPQRRNFEGLQHADVVIPGTPAVDPEASSLFEENARLRAANAQLDEKLQEWTRQSDVDRRKSMALEAETQRERQQRESLERQLQAESEAKQQLSSDFSALQEELEKAKRSTQAQRDASEHMRQLYEERLRERTEELEALQENGRKSITSERQRALALEEQLRSCKEELAASVRRGANSPLPTTGVGEAPNASVSLEVGHLAAAGGDPRRRLFSSTASALENEVQNPNDVSWCLSDGGRGPASSPVRSPQQESGPSVGASWRSAAAVAVASSKPPVSSSRSRLGISQSSGALTASSPPTAQQRSPGASGGGLQRSASSGAAGAKSQVVEAKEAPPKGHVAAMVNVFVRHVQSQSPRRDAPGVAREASRERSGTAAAPVPSYGYGYGRFPTPREGGAAVANFAAPPALPKARQGSRPPPVRSPVEGGARGASSQAAERAPVPPGERCRPPAAADYEDQDPGEWQEIQEEICLGMSPIRRCPAA